MSLRPLLLICMSMPAVVLAADTSAPVVSSDVVFAEHDGLVAVEAEHFFRQTLAEVRSWHVASSESSPEVIPDGDPPHVGGASGGAYLEVLPDTRRTHADKLINGTNFSNTPGKLAVLHYKVHFSTAGRYYVWVRAHSTGPEDNGLHVGLDGSWPASGQRMQWCAGKNTWHWESRQRTEKEHCGEPFKIFLDVKEAGEHTIHFSMREDGFEFDKWLLTTDRNLARPEFLGPNAVVRAGTPLKPFPFVKAELIAPKPAPKPTVPDSPVPAVVPRKPNGEGTVTISGELKQWHKVTLTLDGLYAHERDASPNPFTDVSMTVAFKHESGSPEYFVPGYFAADGDAANTGAQSGTKWRAHLSPDKPGKWSYFVSVLTGKNVIHDEEAVKLASPVYGQSGSFTVAPTDKKGADFRGKGRLQYVGGHYLRFAGSGEYFLKAGPDAPETLLAYSDFDDTVAPKNNSPLKTWQPHLRDWKPGDPTWKDGKGKGLIGALNYLAGQGCNSFSFLPYNAGGDGDNVWPFVSRNEKRNYDCSKLDQWQMVFDHATSLGLHLHFKLQENEIDDNRRGHDAKDGSVPESLDGGRLGTERMLYCRELIARFGHELGLLWNIGEENTQSPQEQREMIAYLQAIDPYDHNIVIHTFPNQQDKVYTALLGDKSLLTGASLQNSWSNAHQQTLKWRRESSRAGRPWVVCNDEQNPASDGVPPDPGYRGHDGFAEQNGRKYNLDDVRKSCLWGTLMAGGAGVEYYFGYKLPQNDLVCEDFRSREQSWEYCRIAINFFREQHIPFHEMENADELVGNAGNTNSRYCFAKPGDTYLVYLPAGGTTSLDLTKAKGQFEIRWFNPRSGGDLQAGSLTSVAGGGNSSIGAPPSDVDTDWLAVVRIAGAKTSD